MAATFTGTGRGFLYAPVLMVFLSLIVTPESLGQVAAPHAALGNTYHVAPGGNDGNNGSAGSPWATLQHAAEQVQPGDLVLVQDGTYIGFQIETSGTAQAPIVFRASGTNAVVDAVNPIRGNDNINVEGADYVVIEGFRVHSASRAGIRIVIARGVVVKDNIVGPNGKWGIFTGFARDVQILDNETFGSADEHGIYVSNSDVAGDNPVIRGNHSHGNNANGIQLNGDCFAGGDGVIEGAIIENNVVHGNNFKGFSLISMAGSVVQNNVIYGNGISAGAGGIHLVDEPGCGLPTVNTVVVNNTIVEPRIAGIRMSEGATDNIIFNNLIVSDRPIRDEVGGNLIDAVTNLEASTTTGLFVDAAGGDYHLAPASPAGDAGAAAYQGAGAPTADRDGVPRPQGSTWDVGAYERSTAAFTITLAKLIRTATGQKKAKIKWTAATVPSGKLDLYIDRTPDGNPDQRTLNDGTVKIKINRSGDGPFAIQACRKNATSFCSNIVTADFAGVPVDLTEPDDDDEETAATKAAAPAGLTLQGSHPNPFNPVATITVDLAEAADVQVEVYDLLGRRMLTPPAVALAAGAGRSLAVDASQLPSGAYVYRVVARTKAAVHVATGRMTLVK